PGQRRADALAELARRQLAAGTLPSVAGHRPQIGVLLHPQALSPDTLARLADTHRANAAGQRLRQLATAAGAPPGGDWTRPGTPLDQHEQIPAGFGRTSGTVRQAAIPSSADIPAGPDPPAPPDWRRPGWADPPWLDWIGPISPATAQRIACDADIWRIILDPMTGTPLDVGRRHRLVPHWIRRAMHTRDRGCRWPGCPTPADWTDAHHLDPWADGGHTSLQRCLLLCRHHHGLVHEAGWRIDLHPTTGQVTITRPEGIPYQPPHTDTTNWNGTTTQATG
ncbi:MAG: HNH endonuclease signature motif containing protein, partial [Natronosporangium sp.]